MCTFCIFFLASSFLESIRDQENSGSQVLRTDMLDMVLEIICLQNQKYVFATLPAHNNLSLRLINLIFWELTYA